MVNLHEVKGPWSVGIALDWHTISSQMVGHDEYGHPVFDTQRSALGELLYRFKYRDDAAALDEIVSTTVECLRARTWGGFDLIVPVPPSTPGRRVTARLAEQIAARIGGECSTTALVKRMRTPELKSILDPDVRRAMLVEAFTAAKPELQGRSILLVDDLYRSGATLEAAAQAIPKQGGAATVHALAITRTRVNR